MAENNPKKIYQIVELAFKTGKIKKGTNETTKAIERGIAKLVLVAQDVNPPEIIMHIAPLCKEKSVLCISVPSREELGAAVGLGVPTTAVVVLQEGEAKELIQELAKQ